MKFARTSRLFGGVFPYRWRRILILAALLFCAGNSGNGLAQRGVGNAGLKPVTVQLNWRHQFEFAAFYAAIQQGYYRQAGLDVRLLEGGPGIDSVGEVLAGRADFGVGNSSLVIERAKGKPVVALAALMQHSAIAVLARRNAGIESVFDLEGKLIACAAHSCDEIMAYLLDSGLRKDRIRFAPLSGEKIEDLSGNKVDAIEVFVTNEPFWIRGQEQKYILLSPRSAGIDLFGNVLFTTNAAIATRHEVVKAFREATLKGLVFALWNQGQLADLILAQYNSQGKAREHLLYEAKHLNDLIRLDLVEPGYMNPRRWEHVIGVYAKLNMIPSDFAAQDFVYDASPKAIPVWIRWALLLTAIGLSLALAASIYLTRTKRRLEQEISVRQKAEFALKKSQEDFRSVVDNANALLSHELRTPLSVIKIHLDVLELRRGADLADMRSIGIIQQAVRRLQDLFGEKIREMFSATSLSVEGTHIQLGTSLKSIIAEFVALWPDNRIHLEVEDAAINVVASASMLKTAIFNLLENAAKYGAKEEGVKVALSRQGDYASISVTNKTATPLPQNLDSLFDKNDRGMADDSVSGLGVGLFLVRLIAESHGGKASARHSDQDQFTVQILFPLPAIA